MQKNSKARKAARLPGTLLDGAGKLLRLAILPGAIFERKKKPK